MVFGILIGTEEEITWLNFEPIQWNVVGYGPLQLFGHLITDTKIFPIRSMPLSWLKYRWNLINNISQNLLKPEPWNLANRLVLKSRWPDYFLNKFWKLHHELWPFVSLGNFYIACFLMHSTMSELCMLGFLIFHIWIPHEKIADTYIFPIRIMPLSWVLAFWKKLDEIFSAKYLKNC